MWPGKSGALWYQDLGGKSSSHLEYDYCLISSDSYLMNIFMIVFYKCSDKLVPCLVVDFHTITCIYLRLTIVSSCDWNYLSELWSLIPRSDSYVIQISRPSGLSSVSVCLHATPFAFGRKIVQVWNSVKWRWTALEGWTVHCELGTARRDHNVTHFGLEGLWLRYAALQNLIPSFPWIAPPRPSPWRNPR